MLVGAEPKIKMKMSFEQRARDFGSIKKEKNKKIEGRKKKSILSILLKLTKIIPIIFVVVSG